MGVVFKTKKQGLLDYGDLIARHGRLVRERWIEGKTVEDASILEAPELGPIADTAAPFELISRIRPLPLTVGSLISLVGAALLPMIVLATLEIPLTTILKSVLTKLL